MLDASPAADAPVRPPVVSVRVVPDAPEPRGAPAKPRALLAAAAALLPRLEAGQALDAPTLRTALTRAFGGSDAQGVWVWKDAYEAAEAALVLFLKRWAAPCAARPGPPRGCSRCWRHWRPWSPPTPGAPRGRSPASSSPPPCRSPTRCSRPRGCARGRWCWNPPPGPGCWPSLPSAPRVPGRGGAAPERARRRAGGDAGRAVPRSVRDPPQRRGHRGLPAPCAALGGAHEPAVLHHPGVDRRRRGADLLHVRAAFALLPPGGRLVAVTGARLPAGRQGLGRRLRAPGPAPAHRLLRRGGRRAYARRGTGCAFR